MHELSIAQNLVQLVEATAAEHQVMAVRSVRVRIGALSGVVGFALESAFGLVREGTVCAGASLDIEDVPVRIACPNCGSVTVNDLTFMLCPNCGRASSELLSGRELEIASIEVDESDCGCAASESVAALARC